MIQLALLQTEHPLYLPSIKGQEDRLVLSFAGVGLRAEFARLAFGNGRHHVLLITVRRAARAAHMAGSVT